MNNKKIVLAIEYLNSKRYAELEELLNSYTECSNEINILLIKAHLNKIKGNKYETLKYYRKAYQINSNDPNILGNLANFLNQFNFTNYRLINNLYKKATSIDSKNTILLKNYAIYKLSKYQIYDAISIFKNLLIINENDIDILIDYGICLYHINENDKSIHYFKKALNLDKSSLKALYNLGLVYLRLENFELGFKHYELRFKINKNINRIFQNTPELNDLELIKKNKVLIWAEQGFGDSIQFSHILSNLKTLKTNITLFCQKELYSIFSESFKNINIVFELSDKEIFDFQISLITLFTLINDYKKYLRNINSFLIVNQEDTSNIKIIKDNKRPIIAITYEGNSKHSNNQNRKISLRYLMFLRKYGQLVIIQKNISNHDQDLLNEYNIKNYGHLLDSFNQTADLLRQCDFLVSVDTSIVHLGGAIGTNVICLLPLNSDWRWGVNAETKLYTSVIQIKQKVLGNWENVLDDLKNYFENK